MVISLTWQAKFAAGLKFQRPEAKVGSLGMVNGHLTGRRDSQGERRAGRTWSSSSLESRMRKELKALRVSGGG